MTSGDPTQGWPGSGQSWQHAPDQGNPQPPAPGHQPGWPPSQGVTGYPQAPGQPWQQGPTPAYQTTQRYPQDPTRPYAPQGPGQPYAPQGPGQPYPAQGPAQAYPPQGFAQPYLPQGPGAGPVGGPAPASGGKSKKLPVILTIVAVVLALGVAGGVYLFARKGTSAAGGAATPKDAIVNLLSSVQQQDPIGVANELDPTEAHLFKDVSGDILSQLKRLGVINQDVSSDKMTGISLTTKDLTYGSAPITLNDHLQIVELTGGTITVQSNGGSSPLSQKVLDVLPPLAEVATPKTETFDISQKVAEQGHPIRLATVKRDGKWYPSLFYTLADNAAYSEKGSSYTLDPIGNSGGSSPEDAMNKLVDALTSGDTRSMISVLSPDEMGVLHDYGNLLVGDGGDLSDGFDGVKLSNLSWAVSDVTGGKKVSVKTMTITTSGGEYTVERDPAAGSLKISTPQGVFNVNADNLDTWLAKMGASSEDLTPQLLDILKREFGKVIALGVVMVQGADGLWYVSPLRSFSDVMVSLLSGLEPADIDYFLSLAHK